MRLHPGSRIAARTTGCRYRPRAVSALPVFVARVGRAPRLLAAAATRRAGPRAGATRAEACRRAGAAATDGRRHTTAASGLDVLEGHQRLAVGQDGPQLRVLRVVEVTLGLDDFEVRGHPDVVFALRRLETLLRQLTRHP